MRWARRRGAGTVAWGTEPVPSRGTRVGVARPAAKITRSARLWRMPSIIEAWFLASESTMQPGSCEASVPRAAQFET